TAFPTQIDGPDLSDAKGWNMAVYYPTIQFGDVNGDGKADVCGRSATAFECWLSDGKSFPTHIVGPDLSDAKGWNQPEFGSTIQVADVNDDGEGDVCGRDFYGVGCWLSTGAAFSTRVDGPRWGDTNGWAAPQYYTSIRFLDVAAATSSNPRPPPGSA